MNGNNSSISANNCAKIFKLKVGEQSFTVEVGDIYSRPILATVDGVQFEVWPEDSNGVKSTVRPVQPAVSSPAPAPARPAPARDTAPEAAGNGHKVHAPIPGTIISILVKPGSQVNPGDELLVLEAMKMKNIIRATHSGVVANIFVITGQTVNHHDPLLDFAE